MSTQCRYVKIGVAVIAWSGVLLVSTSRSHTPAVFGQYSWGQITLVGFLMCAAVMAEHLADTLVSYWTKTSALTAMAGPWEQRLSRVMSKLSEIFAFARRCAQTIPEVTSYLAAIFMSWKRVTHRLMSSGPRP